MLKKLTNYFNTTLFFWDKVNLVCKNLNNGSDKLNVGFCGVYPPFSNGAAAASYYTIKELSRRRNINLFLIPVKNRIDKRIFSTKEFRFTTVKNKSLDVIIFFGLGKNYVKYSKMAKCKKIAWQTLHEDPNKNFKEQLIVDELKNADLIVALTKWSYKCYKKQLKNVIYIPHGVNTDLFQASKKKKDSGKFTCLFTSRLSYYKGIIPFLDAIPIVLKQDNSIIFRIVGAIDEYSLNVDQIKLSLDKIQKEYPNNIIFKNEWIDYNKITLAYKNSDVLIFPSNNEGFGLPIIESMSAQIPCIVMGKKPMSELVLNKETGYCLKPHLNKEKYGLFEFPDPKDIARKIILLKNDNSLRTMLGINGRKRVINEYDIVQTVNKLIVCCYDVCNKRLF